MKKILRYRLFLLSALVALIVLGLKMLADFLGLGVISINTLTGAFFGGVFFTITIVFSGAMADFKEAEKIPGELAVLLKAIRTEALLVIPGNSESKEGKDIISHVENLLTIINSNLRGNQWHKSQLDAEINRINQDINELWAKGATAAVLLKLREYLTNIDRLSHRLDYIAYTNGISGAYIICDLAWLAVLVIFVFAKNEWGIGGLALFTLIAFVLTAIVRLVHDIDNPFEYGKNSVADVDVSVLFKLENFWKNGDNSTTAK